ncbi:MAG: antibiotic biosynthesis monooxygenase [Bacteroidetes bacterium]|nr:antibiotic biosynthesis monooxygenase [Bacteroidota bacterium]
MIQRIVKMGFKPENTSEFLNLFNSSYDKIKNFEGCKSLQLLRCIDDPSIFFTYSTWDSVESLNNYRNSNIFNTIWSKTKLLFNRKPEAWTVSNTEPIRL